MPATRPELGPTLPELLHARFGVAHRTTARVFAGVLVAIVLAVLVALLVHHETQPPQLVHRQPPVFNLITSPVMDRVAPQGDELVRLEGHRGPVHATITIRPLDLPRSRGDVGHGLLPVYIHRYVEHLRATLPGFVLRGEGRARFNNAPGYGVGYNAAGHTKGHLALLLPQDIGVGKGVVVEYRQRSPRGRLSPHQKRFVTEAKSEFRSFRFGTERG